MIILLSPAKKLNFDKADYDQYSIAQFATDSKLLLKDLRQLSESDIKKLMHVSTNIAKLNYERFQNFSDKFTLENSKQAIFAFAGEVYNGLKAQTLNKKDIKFADEHLRILSGFYGILKPLDLMQPYRLEMGTKFANERGKNLYEFWRDKVTEELNKQLEKQKSKLIVNLASNEYFKVLDRKKLDAEIITPIFKNNKNGEYKTIMVYAKHARGACARFIIENKITDITGIKKFNEGYKFNSKLSNEAKGEFLFTNI